MSFASAPPRARLGFLMVTLVRQWRRQVEEQLLADGLTEQVRQGLTAPRPVYLPQGA